MEFVTLDVTLAFTFGNMQYAYFFSVILFLASHYVIVTVNFYKFIMFIAASSVQFSKKVFFFIHGNRPLYPELSYKSCKYSFSCIFARFLIHLYFSFKQLRAGDIINWWQQRSTGKLLDIEEAFARFEKLHFQYIATSSRNLEEWECEEDHFKEHCNR